MLHRFTRLLSVAALSAALIAAAFTATASADSVTALEKALTSHVYGEVGTVESPLGSNYVPNKPYGELSTGGGYAEWCANFVTWAVKASGIDPAGSGRGTFNTNVARAWSVYGPKGGGYGRLATTHNAMPGDLLVDNYDGTASTGGHISVVLRPINSHTVWAVGGNESDGVRLRQKDLDKSTRYLVTLAEFRTRTAPLYREYNTQLTNVGTATMTRYPASTGPALKLSKIVYGATTYSGTGLHSSWTIGSGTSTWPGDTAILTPSWGILDVWMTSNENIFATLTTTPVAIDTSKASSPT